MPKAGCISAALRRRRDKERVMKVWRGVVLAVAAWIAVAGVRADEGFLDAEAAFALKASAPRVEQVVLRFNVAPGYHLYRDRIAVDTEPANAQAGPAEVPHGEAAFDPNFNQTLETLRGDVVVTVPVRATQAFQLHVRNQGCADKGLCFPPMDRAFRLTPTAGGWLVSAAAETAPAAANPSASPTPTVTPASSDATGGFEGALRSHSLWRVAGVFLLAGLLLSFTPCVLPMLPILSSIIVGQAGTVSRARGFSLAAAYSLGMALVYTAFGMAAGLLGEGLAGLLQNAWVLGAFALLLGALALSMFGVYELQMPAAVQTRVTQWSGRLQGGQHAGVFLMGGLSALIVGPCVAAPLAGALVYISQTRDVLIGGLALFALACGMSVPLLLAGLSAGTLLPRAGAWMERVKHLFGILLLGVALWMVAPVLPPAALMFAVGAGLLGLAAYFGAFTRLPADAGLRPHAAKTAGVLCAMLAAFELAGLASGGREPAQPLRHLAIASAQSSPREPALRFDEVRGAQGLMQALRASPRPVMVDFYADWCASCKELEHTTFVDPGVRRELAGFTLLRLDVTASSEEDRAVLKRYGLFGPPALLFFKPAGAELGNARVIGYQPPEQLLQTLGRVRQAL
jgi:thiol:disulfide interchange protein DsbD